MLWELHNFWGYFYFLLCQFLVGIMVFIDIIIDGGCVVYAGTTLKTEIVIENAPRHAKVLEVILHGFGQVEWQEERPAMSEADAMLPIFDTFKKTEEYIFLRKSTVIEKQLRTLFWKRGQMRVTLELPAHTFLLGEDIRVQAKIINHSSVAVRKSKASVFQLFTWNGCRRTKPEWVQIASVTCGVVAPGEKFHWNNVPLKIPTDIPPSDLGPRCRLFKVLHGFQFDVVPEGLHREVKFRSRVYFVSKHSLRSDGNTENAAVTSQQEMPSVEGNDPPPSYEEACAGVPGRDREIEL
ncbi:unnamed protein product [Notodromas monacha]|uniref:Arrestin C-terminal-like domain-containing protein n=1 Tax=Notodromas monacha TaxID=399045 RepID=A0A7R9GF97_9CRUS|nr:unnamed protein product [Notodromas monacha]CAG0920473.1 unnamed protein product [Notodromas monacha]